MNRPFPIPGRSRARQRQRGVALIVALILLIVVTLIGLASIRGTTMQEKMAGNLNDRNVGLQNAEAALRVAQSQISAHAATIWHNCSTAGVACDADPTSAADAANAWQTAASGTGSSLYTAGSNAAGQPQYVIEDMGVWNDPTSVANSQTANSAQYGAGPSALQAHYYRITARSADPASAPDRAVVVLQSWVRQ